MCEDSERQHASDFPMVFGEQLVVYVFYTSFTVDDATVHTVMSAGFECLWIICVTVS